jgi:uncharacterized protein
MEWTCAMRLLVNTALTCLALFTVVILLAYLGQRRLMYFPDRTRVAPSALGLKAVTEHEISVPGGFVIAWWAKARPGQPTLVYYHGNGGSLAARQPRIERAQAAGWGMFMMSYRGYSGAPGTPTEAANVADALTALAFVEAAGVARHDIILYGESLGTSIATQVALARPGIRGLILDAPYTSAVEVGQLRYPFLPVSLAMKDRYETRRFIGDVKAPILILHGARDPVIPVGMGRELAKLARAPVDYVEFPNGGHLDLYIGGNDALAPLKRWIERLPRS